MERELDEEVVHPGDAHIDQVPVHDGDQDSKEAPSRTPIDSEEKRQYEETHTKRRKEHGEASGTVPMAYAQVDRIVVVITVATSASEVQLKQ